MSFAGMSVITDGKKCTTSAVDVGTDHGYHLLVVKDYSRTVQENPIDTELLAGPFMVGGHQWCVSYYPNGWTNGVNNLSDFITLDLFLNDEEVEDFMWVKFEASFVDQFEKQKPKDTFAKYIFDDVNRNCGPVIFMKRDALERSAHLKADCFTIRCDIMVCRDSNAYDVDDTMCDVGQHLDYLLQNKLGADVTFEVSGEMFAAHRCVLAARSTVFMAQLFGPMNECTASSVIQIEDMEPKVFRALLRFIYTGAFPDMDEKAVKKSKKGETVELVVLLQALFIAADRYDLQRLKLSCEEELSEHIGVSSVASTFALAEQHHCHGLKKACLKFIQGQSIPCLEKIMATDGWEVIISTCPSILKEINAKIASGEKGTKMKRKR